MVFEWMSRISKGVRTLEVKGKVEEHTVNCTLQAALLFVTLCFELVLAEDPLNHDSGITFDV